MKISAVMLGMRIEQSKAEKEKRNEDMHMGKDVRKVQDKLRTYAS